MKMNYYGPLSISSYGNTNLIPNFVQQALSSTGIALNHVPSGRKDASDKKILVDMFLWVVENPAPANLMLISGDGDFSDALHRLRMRRYNVLLAHPQQVSVSLVASAKTTWLWRSLLAGGCPLTLYESSWLVEDVSCPLYSEQVLSSESMDLGSGSRRIAGNNKLKGMYVPEASNQLLQKETNRKKLKKNCYKTGSAWFCKVCNVACKSFEVFTAHLSGKEHVAQWELKQNLELLGEPQNIATTPSECQRDVEITNKVVESGVEASEHTMNATTVKKQTEALVDVKNIEESGQDNDLQSRDVQESMKFSEKQNKEVTETWTRSEWRNGRKSWKVKERLENEGGATLNVELSREFRVTKEVRECFGAVLEKLEPSKNEIVVQKLEQGLEIKLGEPENAFVGLIQHIKGDMNKKNKRKKKKKSTVIEYRPEAYVCSYCSVTSDCPTVFESHLKGQKHAAMIKKHTEEAILDDKQFQVEIIQDNGHPKDIINELRFQPGEVPEEELIEPERSVEDLIDFYEEVLENDNQPLPNAEYIFTELNPEFSDPEEAREWFDAIFKKLELSQDANVTRELESIPKQNLEMNSGDPESNSTLGSDKNKKKNKVTKDEAYECTICNVICDCPIVFESHLLGRKHAASVKKHSEVIFDDKKILEESMKEVCGIAKERVENESEEIQIRVCDWCNVIFTSKMDFNSHLIGEKHTVTVKSMLPW